MRNRARAGSPERGYEETRARATRNPVLGGVARIGLWTHVDRARPYGTRTNSLLPSRATTVAAAMAHATEPRRDTVPDTQCRAPREGRDRGGRVSDPSTREITDSRMDELRRRRTLATRLRRLRLSVRRDRRTPL